MDFFESQDVARRRTGRLVVLFVLAVLAIMAMAYLVVAIVLVAQSTPEQGGFTSIWDPRILVFVGLGTLLVVGGGSLYKLNRLRGGGRVVAEQLGGTPLHGGNCDARGRVLLNVVEEMAIASGIPAPAVYVLQDEAGINAFAAGFTPDDAVIGVTRGCLELLSREQLQGVIAHEYSHVLNGDMRLNMRLMGVLHGILVIGLLGTIVLRSMHFSSMRRRSGKDGGGMAAVLAIALGLMVVGFAGVFFGNLIQAAVSRQREFLADASAVQFTRNPGGIAGALKAIGGWSKRSRLVAPHAAEASHLFFGRALGFGVGSLFATHPPLEERIRRIEPGWDGELPAVEAPADSDVGDEQGGGAAAGAAFGLAGGANLARRAVGAIGRPTADHLAYARRLVERLPVELRGAADEPFGARAVVCALLIPPGPSRQAGLTRLEQVADPALVRETHRLLPAMDSADAQQRLPLLDLALPALRALTTSQWAAFQRVEQALVEADETVDLFEWSLRRILRRHVGAIHDRSGPPRTLRMTADQVQARAAVLLSALARAGTEDDDSARRAVAAAALAMSVAEVQLLPAEACDVNVLDRVLDELGHLPPAGRRDVVAGCAACICADEVITATESELLRAVCDGLASPMPPLIPAA
ncbi:MAG: M48 family metallopeptidase [Planctomycetota bacterium]|jgi:Zn-dependent protease with chaperone function